MGEHKHQRDTVHRGNRHSIIDEAHRMHQVGSSLLVLEDRPMPDSLKECHKMHLHEHKSGRVGLLA